MIGSTAGHRMSRSPVSESYGLTADVLRVECLTLSDRDGMYGLLAAYFQNTSRAQFERDLFEKQTVILLRDQADGSVAGFSTLMEIPVTVQGRRVVGFFSGDTIIGREHWGSTLLGRLWLKTVFGEADRMAVESPETQLYWFLISSGYKTWRYLPIFFINYSPHPTATASAFDGAVLRRLASQKFGSEYDVEHGVVRFRQASPLRVGVADVTEQRLRDPLVEFFVRANPGHVHGDELACLARLSRANLTRAGHRLLV
jgi:hypothetical protein